MLKSWKIKNFKSFGKETPISLSAINVLAGANSSGKSSIIQSILLLKQTIQYGASNRSLSLNGPLLRLGTFGDIITSNSLINQIDIEFEFDFTSIRGSVANIPWMQAMRRYHTASDQGQVTQMTGSFSWAARIAQSDDGGSVRLTPEKLTPKLASGKLTMNRTSSGDAPPPMEITYSPTFVNYLDDDDVVIRGLYKMGLDSKSRSDLISGKFDASVSEGYLSFFLPSVIGVKSDYNAQRAADVAAGICDPDHFHPLILQSETIPQSAVSVINDWIAVHGGECIQIGELDFPATSARRAVELTVENMTKQTGGFYSVDDELLKELVELRLNLQGVLTREYGPEFETDYDLPRNVRSYNDFIETYFKQGIRYLGPLRDNPRPVYQLEALESTTNVGYRGEHTAAILDLNSSRRTQYIRPPISSERIFNKKLSMASLHDAVVDWLEYLGVAQEVKTTDAGVFGNRLQVSTEKDGRLHDLTNVGVGVSQVLPIVVMALLAPRSSLLIFEQPELHLHPKVQARLADFFIALAISQKQMILETHSEYLVDRLRLRIAEGEGGDVKELVNIIFTEKEGAETNIRPVEVTEYGAVLDWPKDFFEQSQKDIARILTAGAQKKRRSQKRESFK